MSGTSTEADILALIHATWGSVPSQGHGTRYIVAEHVNDGAGFGYGRTLDAVILDTWPSKGLALHGIEVKVTTADFRRELQDPNKAQAFADYLDMFSIAAPAGIVDLSLLPSKWGLYCPDGSGKLRARRKALYLHEPDADRTVADRSFMAAFCRALQQRSLSARLLEEARQKAVEQTTERLETKYADDRERAERLTKHVAEFEEASGITIGEYRYGNPKQIGEAVYLVLSGVESWRIQRLRKDAADLLAVADSLENVLPEVAAGHCEEQCP